MILHANCKINIGLRVVRKREDGYHDIETVFYPVYGLYDTLEVLPTDAPVEGGIAFRQEGLQVDCDPEKNLVVRCYRLMQSHYPAIGNVQVTLSKHVPFGAGLGGGSSDAAHMAIALNELFHLGLTQAQLAAEMRTLGADCPFFIYNVPCRAEGIGDILTPIDMDLKGKRLVMLKPDVYISTKEAYSGVIIGGTDTTKNYFEDTVFPLHPTLGQIKQRLLDLGADYAAMSGSGSTVFGLFEADTERCTDADLRRLERETSSVVIFNDTLGKAQA